MQKAFTLTALNLLDFQAFSLFFSRQAKRQFFLNTFGIFAEAMIAGFIVDMLAKTQIFTILGAIFAIIWLFFYPFFLKNHRKKALKKFANNLDKNAQKQMNICVNDEYLAFFADKMSDKDRFKFSEVSEIYELKNIFIIYLDKIYIILPKDNQSAKIISQIAKNSDKYIAKYENLELLSVMG